MKLVLSGIIPNSSFSIINITKDKCLIAATSILSEVQIDVKESDISVGDELRLSVVKRGYLLFEYIYTVDKLSLFYGRKIRIRQITEIIPTDLDVESIYRQGFEDTLDEEINIFEDALDKEHIYEQEYMCEPVPPPKPDFNEAKYRTALRTKIEDDHRIPAYMMLSEEVEDLTIGGANIIIIEAAD